MYQFGDGVAKAQYNLVFLYYNSQYLNRDGEAAVKWFRLAAKQGLLMAQTNLGVA